MNIKKKNIGAELRNNKKVIALQKEWNKQKDDNLKSVDNYPIEVRVKIDKKKDENPVVSSKPYLSLCKPKRSVGQKHAIKGFAMQNQYTFIVGDEGTGKTSLCIYFALRNNHRLDFWSRDDSEDVPKGKGGRVLYIQSERSSSNIYDQIYAAGGDGTEIIQIDKFVDEKGNKCDLNLENEDHYKALLRTIELESQKSEGLDLIVFDSIFDFLQSIIFDASKVKERMKRLLNDIELLKLNIGIICVAYMRKERATVDSLHSLYGSGAQSQVATAVWKVREKKDNSGYILSLEKSNWHKNKRHGGFEYNIVGKEIPNKFIATGVELSEEDKQFGAIENLTYLDLSYNDLKKLCVDDLPNQVKKDDKNTIIRKILDGKDKIQLKEVKSMAIQRGLTPSFLRYNLREIYLILDYKLIAEGKPPDRIYYLVKNKH